MGRQTRGAIGLLLLVLLLPVRAGAASPAARLYVTNENDDSITVLDPERQTVLASAEQRAQTLLTAVEAELRGHLSTLEGLAGHPSLEDDDIPYFRSAITNALASHPEWLNVTLILPDGRTIADGLPVWPSEAASPPRFAPEESTRGFFPP